MRKIILSASIFCLLATSVQGQNFYFVFLNTNHEREELPASQVDSIQDAHINNIKRLATMKKLIVAGPFNGGGGIFIFNVSDENEVQNLLKTDPAIAANRFKLEVFPYSPVKGGVCEINIDAEMVTHSFIRIEPAAARDSSAVLSLLENLKDRSKVVASGELGNGTSGIILFDDPSFIHEFKSAGKNPAGRLKYSIRELWVGKGSFCEQE